VTDEPKRWTNDLALAEAEEKFPDAIVQMDHAISHIVHGEDFRLKRTSSKQLQASCAPGGEWFERQVASKLHAYRMRLANQDKTCRACAELYSPVCVLQVHHSTYETILRYNHNRITATWHVQAGVWRRESAHFSIKHTIDEARDTTDVVVQSIVEGMHFPKIGWVTIKGDHGEWWSILECEQSEAEKYDCRRAEVYQIRLKDKQRFERTSTGAGPDLMIVDDPHGPE
jgi:hypothetical protein